MFGVFPVSLYNQRQTCQHKNKETLNIMIYIQYIPLLLLPINLHPLPPSLKRKTTDYEGNNSGMFVMYSPDNIYNLSVIVSLYILQIQ